MRAKYVRLNEATGKGVAERWRRQYQKDGAWRDPKDGEKYERLIALGDSPSAEAVTEVMNNKSWAYCWCDGCCEYVDRVVSIGDSETHEYCATCIAEAAHLLNVS